MGDGERVVEPFIRIVVPMCFGLTAEEWAKAKARNRLVPRLWRRFKRWLRRY